MTLAHDLTVLADDLTTSLSPGPATASKPSSPSIHSPHSCPSSPSKGESDHAIPPVPLESCRSPLRECELHTESSIPGQAPGPTRSHPDSARLSPGVHKLRAFTPVIPVSVISTGQRPGWSLNLAWAIGSQVLSQLYLP